jgi:DNA-binding CsgD family transcriptional regulator
VLRDVVAGFRRLARLEGVLLYSVRVGGRGWAIDRWLADGVPAAMRTRMQRVMETSPEPLAFDLAHPEAAQRNQVIEATSWLEWDGLGSWADSRFCREVMAPLGLAQHRKLRALICEGESLLAAFGAIHPTLPTVRQRRLMTALIPALQRRLVFERQAGAADLGDAARRRRDLEAIDAPAYLIGPRGQLHGMNRGGRRLLGSDTVVGGLRALRSGRPSEVPFEVSEVREPGGPVQRLAVLRNDTAIAALLVRVGDAAARWGLTGRQQVVLEWVCRGEPSWAIAGALGVDERAVDGEVATLVARAGATDRAGLVAVVLGTLT